MEGGICEEMQCHLTPPDGAMQRVSITSMSTRRRCKTFYNFGLADMYIYPQDSFSVEESLDSAFLRKIITKVILLYPVHHSGFHVIKTNVL